MTRVYRFPLIKLLCLTMLGWTSMSWGFTLDAPQVMSLAGEPLRVEIPIRITAEDQAILPSLTVDLPNGMLYEQYGVSQRIVALNPQAMIYRNHQEDLMVLIETVNPVPVVDEPFISVLLNLSWASGSQFKIFTFLLADPKRITVRPGQTLSEIAASILPELNGPTLDQTMIALFKANPDAFASGNINILAVGSELAKPSESVLGSISPSDARQMVLDANQQWRSERDAQGRVEVKSDQGQAQQVGKDEPKDTLRIGSGAESKNLESQRAEQLVAEEKELEQTKSRIVTLEKNISELQGLLDQAKGDDKAAQQDKFTISSLFSQFKLPELPNVPRQAMLVLVALAALAVIALAVILVWGLVRYVRRPKLNDIKHCINGGVAPLEDVNVQTGSEYNIPERAKAIFSGLNLDLSPSNKRGENKGQLNQEDSLVLADALRVKLNLARAYITIEDFSAAKKSLEEVIGASNAVDPTITIEAQGLLSELSHRQS
ncbi:FimV/HubP family polar landmark protein [Polynucleobacter sp. MWH-UH2A]|uniref:FimV/HubP family polar landmark protein n=1 Tax=Polynucleobacter sp. MWH-UH2A TaxID=1855617 RepID=UPI001BFD6D2D|nr:FimV/HubP family polar landmark protein [Polynucleobacter sp. MWH-UH2A]QWD63278.1 pilus assembly protein FimV [Polynucleobacter sp. MWH-UH2A]